MSKRSLKAKIDFWQGILIDKVYSMSLGCPILIDKVYSMSLGCPE